MKRRIAGALVLLTFCLCGGACGKTPSARETTTAPPVSETAQETAALSAVGNVTYAGWSSRTEAVAAGCLNADLPAPGSARRLPVFAFRLPEELERFRQARAELLSLESGYDEAASFVAATARYDDAFFAENTLLLAYLTASSGSYRFGLARVERTGDACCLYAVRLNDPEVTTCDMAGWFVMAEVPNAELAGCVAYDALLADDAK